MITLGKAIELAHPGARGILVVMPFLCMPGVVSASIACRLHADLNNAPRLNVSCDLQKSTNLDTRLEAFMSQARHFERHAVAA